MRFDDIANQLASALGQVKQSFVTALPNLVTALAVLVVGWALAWALRRAVSAFFARIASRLPAGRAGRTSTGAVEDHGAGSLAARGVYWLVLLFTVVIAIDALDLPVLRRWMGVVAGYAPRLAMAAALILGGVIVGRVAASAILETSFRMTRSQARGLARLTQVTVVVAAVLIAAGQLGLDVSLLTSVFLIALASMLGAAALAFGLGARDVMADILAMHYARKSYRIGQVIRVGEDQGRIVRLTRTSVYLEHADGELAISGRDLTESRCVLVSEGERGGS